jgi:voltage-gated potassium channel
MVDNQPAFKRITLYDLILMTLAFVSIIIVTFLIFLPRDEGLYRLIRVLDSLIALVFLGDFFFRFVNAKDRKEYFFKQLGWLDLLGGIPLNGVGIFRLARIVRGFRALRHTNAREFFSSLRDHLAQNTLVFTVFMALLAVFAASAIVLVFEAKTPGSNIHTSVEAIWWAFVTIATVGYGDYVPVTTPGRITGILLMLVGVGIFGVLSAFLANAFISPSRKNLHTTPPSDLVEMKTELVELRQLLAQIQTDLAKIPHQRDEGARHLEGNQAGDKTNHSSL